MPVPMRVRLARRIIGGMVVLVVGVMNMPMLMFQRLVRDARARGLSDRCSQTPDAHQGGGGEELERDRLPEQQDRQTAPMKGAVEK